MGLSFSVSLSCVSRSQSHHPPIPFDMASDKVRDAAEASFHVFSLACAIVDSDGTKQEVFISFLHSLQCRR